MKQLVCEMCGSNDLVKKEGVFVCQACGTKYSVEEARKMMVEGTVKVDNSHMVSNYLEMAINAYKADNQAEAEAYCNKTIEIEPTNHLAWMLKGKAAGWQSTIQSPRIPEAVLAFTKAVQYAPEEEKEDLAREAKTEIQNLSKAMLKLRGERFVKWPDNEEANGFISDLTAIINSVVQFITQVDVAISIPDIMRPAAEIIDQAVIKAFKDKIVPDYKSDRYPWPDDDDFRKYIDRIGYCTTLIEKAIKLCDDDDDEDIQRYENLVFLHKQAIGACSYKSEFYVLDEPYKVDFWRKRGAFPIKNENRVYSKNLSLAYSAVTYRNNLILQYENKISHLKAAKNRRIAAEKAEKERKAKEASKKRFEKYWKTHSNEKKKLESELKTLKEQIDNLNASCNDQVVALNKEISAIPGQIEIDNLNERVKKLSTDKASLGVFKGKEKKALQEQIDKIEAEIKTIRERMSVARSALEAKIATVKVDNQEKTVLLQSRIKEINVELTKER